MHEQKITIIKKDLKQITDMLLLNGTLTECPGLIHGKMGVSVFFFHYARFTSNSLFADYAMDLIAEMLNQIHVNNPADYEKGIAGIGVGIDYLIRNNFLDVEDDICEDFDQRMLRAVMFDPWSDFSHYSGLTGYGRYWITRLSYEAPLIQARECLLYIISQIEEKLEDISTLEQTDVFCFLHNLQRIPGFENCVELLEQCQRKWDLQSSDIIRRFLRLGDSAVGNIVRIYQRSQFLSDFLQNEIDIALKQIPALNMEKAPTSMGLLTGYAGEGMLRLTALDQKSISWMYLL